MPAGKNGWVSRNAGGDHGRNGVFCPQLHAFKPLPNLFPGIAQGVEKQPRAGKKDNISKGKLAQVRGTHRCVYTILLST